jgi:starch phosphorylase
VVERVRRCIVELAPRFSTHRMVKEYAQKYYFPAHNAAVRLEADGFAASIALADHVQRFRKHFGRVRVNSVRSEPTHDGALMEVAAVVELNGLRPDEVVVQVLRGLLDRSGELVHTDVIGMEHEKDLHDGAHRFRAGFAPTHSAREAWIVRVLPWDKACVCPFIPGLIVSGPINRAEAHAEPHG